MAFWMCKNAGLRVADTSSTSGENFATIPNSYRRPSGEKMKITRRQLRDLLAETTDELVPCSNEADNDGTVLAQCPKEAPSSGGELGVTWSPSGMCKVDAKIGVNYSPSGMCAKQKERVKEVKITRNHLRDIIREAMSSTDPQLAQPDMSEEEFDKYLEIIAKSQEAGEYDDDPDTNDDHALSIPEIKAMLAKIRADKLSGPSSVKEEGVSRKRAKISRSHLRHLIKEELQSLLIEKEEFMQDAAEDTEKSGRKGVFKNWCEEQGFEGVNQSCVDKAYKTGKPWKRRAALAVTYSRAKGGAPSLRYPEDSD